MQEADRQLLSAPESDIKRFDDGEAMAERIREWLDTPEGTMAHHPSWGHNLSQFKHDPLCAGGNLEVLIEMAIARKLPVDVQGLILKGVNVVVKEIDLCRVEILHQFGAQSEEVNL